MAESASLSLSPCFCNSPETRGCHWAVSHCNPPTFFLSLSLSPSFFFFFFFFFFLKERMTTERHRSRSGCNAPSLPGPALSVRPALGAVPTRSALHFGAARSVPRRRQLLGSGSETSWRSRQLLVNCFMMGGCPSSPEGLRRPLQPRRALGSCCPCCCKSSSGFGGPLYKKKKKKKKKKGRARCLSPPKREIKTCTLVASWWGWLWRERRGERTGGQQPGDGGERGPRCPAGREPLPQPPGAELPPLPFPPSFPEDAGRARRFAGGSAPSPLRAPRAPGRGELAPTLLRPAGAPRPAEQWIRLVFGCGFFLTPKPAVSGRRARRKTERALTARPAGNALDSFQVGTRKDDGEHGGLAPRAPIWARPAALSFQRVPALVPRASAAICICGTAAILDFRRVY
ncbi:uncharacterized protein LOC121073592 isoform X1 [Cygnus olor]|uniref:uncharacterized protein LOC121073592 isoform X1 n=1 Tax=Cygnus olor TaxID=8869 RepID=UPI001ADE2B32|nr:uncharacterized protein LOC121073592 isoform X1 [Cygnus olor]